MLFVEFGSHVPGGAVFLTCFVLTKVVSQFDLCLVLASTLEFPRVSLTRTSKRYLVPSSSFLVS